MRKIFSFVILVSLIFGTVAAGEEMKSQDSLSEGISLFKTGQYQASYAMLLRLFQVNPENLELNFYLGRAAFEIEQYEMAIMAYERILIAAPSENRVKLELARAFYAIKDNNSARRYIKEVLADNPPSIVKKNIENFLSLIDRSEQTHFLKGQVSVAVDWNNNVWASPSTGTIRTVIGDVDLTGPSAQKTQDWLFSTTVSVDHTYRFQDRNVAWKTDATFLDGIYDKTSALDIRYIGGLTGPEIITGNRKYGIKLRLGQIDLGNERYMDSKGVSAFLDYLISPAWLIRTGGIFEQKNFPGSSARDSNNMSVRADLAFPWHDNWLDIGLGLEKESAFDDEFSYRRLLSHLSVSRQMGYGMTGWLNYRYQFSKYDKPGSLFDQKRQDHQHTIGCGIEKPLWRPAGHPGQALKLRLSYQHVWAFSNLDLYEYTQDLCQVSLVYNF